MRLHGYRPGPAGVFQSAGQAHPVHCVFDVTNSTSYASYCNYNLTFHSKIPSGKSPAFFKLANFSIYIGINSSDTLKILLGFSLSEASNFSIYIGINSSTH